jgi:hypothetical protein
VDCFITRGLIGGGHKSEKCIVDEVVNIVQMPNDLHQITLMTNVRESGYLRPFYRY